jgi:hypothetical protein
MTDRDIEELNRVTIHELLREDMERGMNAMRSILDQQMFVHAFDDRPAPPPVTWRDRLRWKWNRFTVYFYTIWRALRGDELDTPGSWDDY